MLHPKVQFSPRRTKSIGLTDGEGVERFWAYLRQFSSITKEMSVDKRNDVLTDAALHYGEHLFSRFGMNNSNGYSNMCGAFFTVFSLIPKPVTCMIALLPPFVIVVNVMYVLL